MYLRRMVFPDILYHYHIHQAEKSGGGLAIGALPEANPTVVSEGDEEAEILVVQIEIEGLSIRCICAYGPQEYDKSEKKDKLGQIIF